VHSLIQKLMAWLAARYFISLKAVETPLLDQPAASNAQIADEGKALVPYDAGLYDLVRSRWEFGDWASLKSIAFETIADHPERAKLALFVGAGYAQTFDYEKAGLFFKAAKDWGCSKRLLAQVMAAGLHNTYGRAAAMAGDERRALLHLQQALSVVKPSGDLTLMQKARVQEQLSQLGIVNVVHNSESQGLDTISSSAAFKLASQPERNGRDLSALVEKTQGSVDRLKADLDKVLKKEVENSTKQLMAFMSLERFFETGELAEMNTERHNWPVSPDLALLLVSFLEKNTYDLIVEFGSGFSTRLIAKTLNKTAEKSGGTALPKFISFDHLEKYHNKTRDMLSYAALDGRVELALTPLAMVNVPARGDYLFYDCASALQRVLETTQNEISRIFVLVDGPPGDTGPHARYPALNAVASVFPQAAIHLILDDYIRPEEKRVAQMWIEDLQSADIEFTKEEIKLNKDACFLNIKGKHTESGRNG